jgi:hypothetical protein
VNAPAERYRELIEEGWWRAWEHYEGGFRGFSRDVNRAWERMRELADNDMSRLRSPLVGLGGQIRCLLCLSSIRSIGVNIPSSVICDLVRFRLMHPRQGLYIAELQRDAERGVTLAMLASNLPPDLISEALVMAQNIRSPLGRAAALAGLAAYTPLKSEQTAVVDRALEAFAFYEPSRNRPVSFDADSSTHPIYIFAVALLLPFIQPASRSELLQSALTLIAKTAVSATLLHAIKLLFEYLPAEELRSALAEQHSMPLWAFVNTFEPATDHAVRAARMLEDLSAPIGFERGFCFAALLAALPESEREVIASKMVEELEAVQWDAERAAELAFVAISLQERDRQRLTADTFAVIWRTSKAERPETKEDEEAKRFLASALLAVHLPDADRLLAIGEMLKDSRSLEFGTITLESLAMAALIMPPFLSKSASDLAHRLGSVIGDFRERALPIAFWATELAQRERRAILAEALRWELRDEEEVAKLCLLAPQLTEDDRNAALARAERIVRQLMSDPNADPESWLISLVFLLPFLSEPERSNLLRDAIERGREEKVRAWFVGLLVPRLPTVERDPWIAEAETLLQQFIDADSSDDTLVFLLPGLLSLFDDTKRQTMLISIVKLLTAVDETSQNGLDEENRAMALAMVIPQLPAPERSSALRKFFALAEDMDHEMKATSLWSLSSLLPERELYKEFAALMGAWATGTREDVLVRLSLSQGLVGNLFSIAVNGEGPTLLERVGGKVALTEAANAIYEVGQWWP